MFIVSTNREGILSFGCVLGLERIKADSLRHLYINHVRSEDFYICALVLDGVY